MNCYTIFISGVRMPVVSCDSQGKRMVVEARYMCNVTKQHRYFTTARSKRKEEVTVLSDRYLLRLAVRMVALAYGN